MLAYYPEVWEVPHDERVGGLPAVLLVRHLCGGVAGAGGLVRLLFGGPDPYSSANGMLCPCQKILRYLRSFPFAMQFVNLN